MSRDAGQAGRSRWSSVAWLVRCGSAASNRLGAFARHPDPLVQATNWAAILIGTHLPFWPLYVRWSAGPQADPTALLTMAPTPVFLLIPLLARKSGLLARVATPVAGIGNTVFTLWILGADSGTALFLAPCSALAALSFRRRERGLMLALALLPLGVFYLLKIVPLAPLHRYDAEAAKGLFSLNVVSVAVLAAAFGWLQGDVYRRMEAVATGADPGTAETAGPRPA